MYTHVERQVEKMKIEREKEKKDVKKLEKRRIKPTTNEDIRKQ